jgi:hypothetical protein
MEKSFYTIRPAKAAKIKRYILAKYSIPWEFMIFYQGTNLVFIHLVLIKKTKLGGHNYDTEKF